jgi:hypothetical protein
MFFFFHIPKSKNLPDVQTNVMTVLYALLENYIQECS